MRTATETPEIGQTVRKTTVTTVLPAETITAERKTPDFWPYVESLTSFDWEKHLLYVYRRLGTTGAGLPLEKISGSMLLADGKTLIPMTNREEIEFAIAQKYGGGEYRLILKKGAERVTEGRVNVDGPPLNTKPGILTEAPAPGSQAQPSANSPTQSDVATTAMHLVANHEAEAINVGVRAMQGAAEVIQRLAGQGNGGGVNDQILSILINRALAPAPDPMDSLTKMLAVLQSLNAVTNPGSATNPAVTRILDIALERFVNPPPAGPVSSAGAELVRQLPQVAGYVTEAIREWKLGSEAQLETARIMAHARPPALPPGQAPPGQVQPPPRPITQATQVQPNPAPSNGAPPVNGTPSLEFIEGKIVEILKKQISADEAADEVLSFLDLMAPSLVDQLAAVTESQLVQLFQTRPVLAQYHDLARLQEFIRAFLRYANETGSDAAPANGAPKPN